MKRIILLFFLVLGVVVCKSQCNHPATIFSDNVFYYNANTNWTSVSSALHYKIRYKELGSSSWLYKNNINPALNQKMLSNLQPLSTYIWQIRSHCDTTNNIFSNWSSLDTFTTNTNLCPLVTGLYTNNITYNSACANWDGINQADRYKLHYRIYGTTNWSNLAYIDGQIDSATIPVLQANTTYEWQVMAYYDSTNIMGSLWSVSDTFTTSIFVPEVFNPLTNSLLDIPLCNVASPLSLRVSQISNEPDIETSTITSSGGYFDIQSVAMGDSVGYAIINTSAQAIYNVLRIGFIAGQNYAIVNAYDSSGGLNGFFSIENTSSGIKVSSTSPNDGNNYTSGYTSQVNFTNLFVNPNINGPIYFYAEIESELNDVINTIDTVLISCSTPSIFINEDAKKIDFSYDIYGRSVLHKKGFVLTNKNNNIKKTWLIKK